MYVLTEFSGLLPFNFFILVVHFQFINQACLNMFFGYTHIHSPAESRLPNGNVDSSSTEKNKFDDKIEASSAKMYFHYYGQLLHQQNMLQDYVRTGYFIWL